MWPEVFKKPLTAFVGAIFPKRKRPAEFDQEPDGVGSSPSDSKRKRRHRIEPSDLQFSVPLDNGDSVASGGSGTTFGSWTSFLSQAELYVKGFAKKSQSPPAPSVHSNMSHKANGSSTTQNGRQLSSSRAIISRNNFQKFPHSKKQPPLIDLTENGNGEETGEVCSEDYRGSSGESSLFAAVACKRPSVEEIVEESDNLKPTQINRENSVEVLGSWLATYTSNLPPPTTPQDRVRLLGDLVTGGRRCERPNLSSGASSSTVSSLSSCASTPQVLSPEPPIRTRGQSEPWGFGLALSDALIDGPSFSGMSPTALTRRVGGGNLFVACSSEATEYPDVAVIEQEAVASCVDLEEKERYEALLRQTGVISSDGIQKQLAAQSPVFCTSKIPKSPASSATSLNLFDTSSSSSRNLSRTYSQEKSASEFMPISVKYHNARRTLRGWNQPSSSSTVLPQLSQLSQMDDSNLSTASRKSSLTNDASVQTLEERTTVVPGPVSTDNDVSQLSSVGDGRSSNRWQKLKNDFEDVKLSTQWVNKFISEKAAGVKTRQRRAALLAEEAKLREEERRKLELERNKELQLRFRLEGLRLTVVPDIVFVEEEEEEKEFPELSEEQQTLVSSALQQHVNSEQILVEEFNIPIRRKDIQTLIGLNWLNDEVINFYFNLLMARSSCDKKLPKVYVYNTFFATKIATRGSYSMVKRWTKKVDIFSHDLLLIPVHLGAHWCLEVVDFRKSSVFYYDSMGGSNNSCMQDALLYLNEESRDKRNKPFDTSSWKTINVKNIPHQMNGSDCGMFTCKFAEYVSRDANITFTQEHMPYFRKRMIAEILQKKLMNNS